MKLTDILLEYTDKTINSTIERWKGEYPQLDDNLAKQVIQRFDQVKGGLGAKLQIIALSDELKQGNNYLNIDKYGWEDMVRLIRSLPEKEDKIKKEAVKKLSSEAGIPEATVRGYVARFFSNKANLQFAAKEGMEHFSKEDVLKLIPRNLQNNEAFLDPRNWRWESFEQMMDALFPSQKQQEDGDENYATTDADKVYDQGGIEIYKGDDVSKCISYSPYNPKTSKKKYGWCVSQVGNTNYDYYRFEERSPTFYFVFDRNKPSEPEHSPFRDKWHAFVVQVNKNGKGEEYRVTSANNDADNRASSWEAISDIVPPETWNRIKGLKTYFEPIDLSPVERGRKFASGKNLSLNEFLDLTTEEKTLYIQGKASKNSISDDILAILPKIKIPLEGRSTTLANVAIDNGQEFPYSSLENNESLAKRYAIFRFRHTDYSKNPIPLPYVKYLDEAAKEKYLETFDNNLNYDYIEKYFGIEATQNYINEQLSKLDYLPEKAASYIKNPKLRSKFLAYYNLFESWEWAENFNIGEEELSKFKEMPVQDVDPKLLNAKQWNSISPEERKTIINIAKEVNGNPEYSTMLYALPYILEDNGRYLILLPIDNSDFVYENWVLVDENNKVVKKDIDGKYWGFDTGQKDGKGNKIYNQLQNGYPNIDEDPRRIYDINELEYIPDDSKRLMEIKINTPKLQQFDSINNNSFDSWEDVEVAWEDIRQEVEDRLGNIGTIINQQEWDYYSNNFENIIERNFEDKYGVGYYDLRNYYEQFRKKNLREIKVNNPNKNAKYIPLLKKYNINQDWLLLHLGDIDDLSPKEWDDLEYVEDRINHHLDNMRDDEELEGDLYDDETFEERFLRERLMSRAGIKK